MPTLISTACTDLSLLREGIGLALGKLTAVDQAVEQSLAPMGRAGFVAAATQLRQAQQRVRQLRAEMATARTGVHELAASLSRLLEESSAECVVQVLAPAGAQLDRIKATVQQTWGQVRPVPSAIAAAANQNPALVILTELGGMRLPAEQVPRWGNQPS